ncbi:MAG: MBL fold metallo-hydrolase, partial [Armatimonadetes bacterium]|nr:MBL fold metallo-hydrolase [Armatimonadota bacterium]
MRVQQVNEHIYRVMLAWGNAYVLKEGDRVALIDTGLQKDRSDLLCALKEIGVEAQQVSTVFLTHGHTDHAGNAALFAKQGAKLYAHTLEIPHLRPPILPYSYD